MSESAEGAWAGEAPSWTQAFATLYGGVVALMIGGVQPLVLGGLVDAGRIGLVDVGRISTLEALGQAAGATLGPWLLRRVRARVLGFVSAAAIAIGNLAMPAARTLGATLSLRGAIGLAEGALLSLTIALIARAPAPERWSGSFLGVQTLAQSAGAWAIPALLAGALGPNAGFWMLAAMAGIACAVMPLAAHERPAASGAREAHTGRIPGVAWLGLAFVFVSLASSSAVWSYFERLGDAHGYSEQFLGAAAAANLVAQAVGSFAATGVGPRLRWLAAVAVAALAQLAAIRALGAAGSAQAYALAGVVFGFFWLFGMPYQVRALVELDPSRSSARWIASAQILGGALGPLAAASLVPGDVLAGVLRFGAGAMAVAVGLAVAAWGVGRRRTP